MKLEKWHISITLVCLLFGILFTSNLKTRLQEYNPLAARNKTLVNFIKSQDLRNLELESEIKGLRDKIEKYHISQSTDGGLDPIKKDLDRLKSLSGLTEVKGPGIKITLNDQDKASIAKDQRDADFYIIHYYNILYVVNDLRAAGAEAISVNGERVVSTTDIRCAGVFITVNNERLAPPYEIKAIGNPELLEISVRSGEYSSLELAKFPVTLEKLENLTLPPYKGSYAFNYATIPKEGGE